MTYDRLSWPARSRHTGMRASIFSLTQTTSRLTRAGGLVYVRVESGCDRTGDDICGTTDHFAVLKCLRSSRVYMTHFLNLYLLNSFFMLIIHVVNRPCNSFFLSTAISKSSFWIELNWIKLNWIELNWIEWNWIELNWIELNWMEWDKKY